MNDEGPLRVTKDNFRLSSFVLFSMSENFSILYLGMPLGGELSRRPLTAILEAGLHVCAVVVPGAASEPDPVSLTPPPAEDLGGVDFVPLVSQYMTPSVITLAWERQLPLFSIGDLSRPAAYDTLAAFQPDVMCVACFSRIIPPATLNLPRLGAINLHPSLLPAYRGPWPLFWQFKAGEKRTGVTLHFMNERVDAGDILLQAETPFADGMSGAEAESLCAEAGGRLMVEGLGLIQNGNPPRRPQDEAAASYQSFPSRADLVVHPNQPAQRAFNFMRGARSLIGNAPFEISAGGTIFHAHEAIEYSAAASLGEPYRREGDEVWIQFEPGTVKVRASNDE